jgi:hypothetical protein
MDTAPRTLLAKGLLQLANLLAGVFIVGLSLTENSIAAYVPVIGIATVAGLYLMSYAVLRYPARERLILGGAT